MLVLVLPPVSSRVIGFMVASPCLWGKLQNMSLRHVSKCENWRTSRTKCSFWCSHVSCLESLVSCGVAVSMGEAGKPLLLECVQAGCHVVLRGRRGALWHSKLYNLFDNVLKMSKLEEVSYEMLVFLHPRVFSSGFPVASPCLWGKLRTPHSTLYTPQFTL